MEKYATLRELFENEWFPQAYVFGITWENFWHMNPRIIKCISLGHEKKIKEQDALIHTWVGTYGLSALQVAIEHCMAGKKAKSKFIENPIMSDFETEHNGNKSKDENGLSEKEKLEKTEQLFMKLNIMSANYELANKGGVE